MMRTVIIMACGCVLLPGSELVIRDLRLGVGARSTAFDYTVHGTTVDGSGKDNFDGGWALEGGGRWSLARSGSAVGLVLGGDIIIEALPYGGGGMGTSWLHAMAGGGWAVDDRWTLVAGVGAQIGASTFDHGSDAHQNASTQTGTAMGYDLRLEATCQVTRRLGIGGHIGWLMAKHRLADDRLDTSVERSGWVAGVQVVWRFSNAPTRLE
jgi:hypothetical protein